MKQSLKDYLEKLKEGYQTALDIPREDNVDTAHYEAYLAEYKNTVDFLDSVDSRTAEDPNYDLNQEELGTLGQRIKNTMLRYNDLTDAISSARGVTATEVTDIQQEDSEDPLFQSVANVTLYGDAYNQRQSELGIVIDLDQGEQPVIYSKEEYDQMQAAGAQKEEEAPQQEEEVVKEEAVPEEVHPEEEPQVDAAAKEEQPQAEEAKIPADPVSIGQALREQHEKMKAAEGNVPEALKGDYAHCEAALEELYVKVLEITQTQDGWDAKDLKEIRDLTLAYSASREALGDHANDLDQKALSASLTGTQKALTALSSAYDKRSTELNIPLTPFQTDIGNNLQNATEELKAWRSASPSASLHMDVRNFQSALQDGRAEIPETLHKEYDAYIKAQDDMALLMDEFAAKEQGYLWTQEDLQQITEKKAAIEIAGQNLTTAAEGQEKEIQEKIAAKMNLGASVDEKLSKAYFDRSRQLDPGAKNTLYSDAREHMDELAPATPKVSVPQQEPIAAAVSKAQLNTDLQYQYTKLKENRANVPAHLLSEYDEYMMAFREVSVQVQLSQGEELSGADVDRILQEHPAATHALNKLNRSAGLFGGAGPIQDVLQSSKGALDQVSVSCDKRVSELDPNRKSFSQESAEKVQELATQDRIRVQQMRQQNPQMQQGQVPPQMQGQVPPQMNAAQPTAPQQQPVPQQPAPEQPAPEQPTVDGAKIDPATVVKTTKLGTMGIREQMIEATKGVHMGSKQYDQAYQAFNAVNADWIVMDAQHKTWEDLSESDIRRLRTKITDAKAAIDLYQERKNDQGSARWGEKDKKRIATMDAAMKNLEAQEALLDAREKAMEDAAAPTPEEVSLRTGSTIQQMEEAEKSVHFGSKEYTAAKVAFSKLDDRWKEIHAKGPDYKLTAEDIRELRELSDAYDTAADAYLMTKEGKDLKAKTQNRVEAIWAGKDAVKEQLKTLDAAQEELDKTPAKNMSELIAGGDKCVEALEAATVGVHRGSKEYKDAMELYKKNQELMKKLNGDEFDHALTAREREQLEKQREETIQAIDRYLDKKKDQKLGEKTRRRVEAMKQARENLVEQKKKIDERKKKMQEDARNLDPDVLDAQNTATAKEMKSANKRVWRGSTQYKEAMASFEHSTNVMKDYYHGGVPDRAKSEKTIEELRETQKKIAAYLDRKGDGPLDKKGEWRREVMRRAYDEITQQIDRIEDSLVQSKDKKKEADKKVIKDGVERLKNRRDRAKGKERLMGDAAYKASQGLEKLAKKESLSAADKQKARYAMAALVLQEKLMGPDGEKFKKTLPSDSKHMAKAIMAIANSPEFVKAFPDDSLTPDKCSKMLSDPKQVRNGLRAFDNATREAANMTKENIKKKQLEMEQPLKMA
ncbi:MAG: hypothetical protein K6E92_01615 [Lachnospiraceae bacterium]|nr:hypothetical protein [Lachnospiraceae bacterium]